MKLHWLDAERGYWMRYGVTAGHWVLLSLMALVAVDLDGAWRGYVRL